MGIEARIGCDVVLTARDQFMAKQALRGFYVIKLDLQVNELQALKGPAKALKTCNSILVEVNFRERSEGCTQFNQLYDVLADAGYCLYKIYEIHGYSDGSWKLGDGLFLKSELLRE